MRYLTCTGSPLNTYQCSHVGIGLLVQQKLRDSVVATVSCNVQRREVVQRDIINRRLVLQQQFHAFYVVALGWHVQRGQSVLCEDKSKMWYRTNKKKSWMISDIYFRYLFYDGTHDCSTLCSLTLVLAKIGAPLSNRISTAWSCPLLAAQCSGVSPSWQRHKHVPIHKATSHSRSIANVTQKPTLTLVLASIWAPRSSSRATILVLPLLEATWRGVIPF